MTAGGRVARPGVVPSLELREVSVAYGTDVAIDRVSLAVDKGETLAVVGPSGSGKSTLLRAVAGLEPLAGGAVLADGVPLDPVPTHRRDLGLMFQDHALFPHLDVAANVGFGLRMKRWSSRRRRERVDELLEVVGLGGFGHRAVHELSGGEAQRVALARALAPEPGLLMLDEPFGSLDRLLREELTAQLRRLLTDLGQTALHVTHDQGEAFALADRVAVLADGRLQQLGPPAELWRRPASTFVAEFLGHPNVWPAVVDGNGGVTVGERLIVDRSDLAPGAGSLVVPVTALDVDVGGSLAAVVETRVFREGRYRVVGRLAEVMGGGSPLVVTFDADDDLHPGERVALTVDVELLHHLP